MNFVDREKCLNSVWHAIKVVCDEVFDKHEDTCTYLITYPNKKQEVILEYDIQGEKKAIKFWLNSEDELRREKMVIPSASYVDEEQKH